MFSFIIGSFVFLGLYRHDPALLALALVLLAGFDRLGGAEWLADVAAHLNEYYWYIWLTKWLHGLPAIWTYDSGEGSFSDWAYLAAFLVWVMEMALAAALVVASLRWWVTPAPGVVP